MAHNVSAVYDVFGGHKRALRSKDRPPNAGVPGAANSGEAYTDLLCAVLPYITFYLDHVSLLLFT
jgi:hypothetical protein